MQFSTATLPSNSARLDSEISSIRKLHLKHRWMAVTSLLRQVRSGPAAAAGVVVIHFDREDLSKEVMSDADEAEILARLLPAFAGQPGFVFDGSTWLLAEVQWRFSTPNLKALVRQLEPWLLLELNRKGARLEWEQDHERRKGHSFGDHQR